jgi:triacylglycerol esterase/lipase EstA (alpha/beta hydrolase family)
LNTINYWVGVEDLLEDFGFYPEVRAVPAFDDTYIRSVLWLEHLDAMVAEGVGRRFNLIGHSQGGLDARYLTSILDSEHRIVTVTTISTPHFGTSIADLFTGAVALGPGDGAIIDALVSGTAELFGSSGSSLTAQLEQMNIQNMEQFNDDTPNLTGVQYFSWAGKSCRYFQFGCQSSMEGETVSSYFLLSHGYIETWEGDNDGLVSVRSAKWGEFLGVLPADHMDEVGHRFDLSTQPFDASSFYLSEARRLAELGF